jgi:alkylation response protein AidB-like acyl-CoA dehydrogenase
MAATTSPKNSSIARPTKVEQLLADVNALAKEAAPRATEIENARRIPADLAARLREIGIFRMFVPRSHGGLELDFPDSLDVAQSLAAADGSLGWVAMLLSHFPLATATLPRKTFDRIYANTPDVIGGGSVYLGGKATAVDGGYRMSGRWPFASGCEIADYLLGGFHVVSDKPASGPAEAVQPWRICLAPIDQWRIEDTWQVSGLKGTGSHHVSLDNVFIPEDMTFEFFTAPSNIPGPLYARGTAALSMLHIGAIAVGVAEGAIADLVAIARTGRRQVKSKVSLNDSPVFQQDLGRIEADIRAADAYLRMQTGDIWRIAVAGEPIDEVSQIRGAQATAWVVSTCAKAVDQLYTLGGGQALYDSSPLQRRLRDIHGVTQHQAGHPVSFGMSGRVRLGFPSVDPWMG